MRNLAVSLIIATPITFIYSCKKDSTASDCFPNATTTRQIIDKPAVVTQAGTTFYLIERGTIDTKLNPCNLPSEFKIDNLCVTISGDIKATTNNTGPCCKEDFVITKITR